MISHKLKCIFIHVPRTAGSSIEKSLVGGDWWHIQKDTKHLLASQAKKIYADYWDNYFKFSFVRDPHSRMLSMNSHRSIRKVYFGNTKLKRDGIISVDSIDTYKKKFGNPVLIEYDYRFYKREEVETQKHKSNCVYGNILDEPIDYVGKFENLEADFNKVCKTLGLRKTVLPKIGQYRHSLCLGTEAKFAINKIYEQDFINYNYSPQE